MPCMRSAHRRYLDGVLIHDRRAVDRRFDPIIVAIKERRPKLPLHPADEAKRRRLEREEFADKELGPHIRRALYREMLPPPELTVPLFAHGDLVAARTPLDHFPALRASIQRTSRSATRQPTAAAHTGWPRWTALSVRSQRGAVSSATHSRSQTSPRGAARWRGAPPRVPYPMSAQDDPPNPWREFVDLVAQQPGGPWVAVTYCRHRSRPPGTDARWDGPTQALTIVPV